MPGFYWLGEVDKIASARVAICSFVEGGSRHCPNMPTIDDTPLLEVFQRYCNFGTRNNSLPNDSRRASITVPQMDGSKFAKLAREAGILDPHAITPIEIDILFSKVKDKTERKISFLQFQTALKSIAEKKHQSQQDEFSVEEIEKSILEAVCKLGGPQLAEGTTLPEKSPMIDRLMEGPATYISKSPKDETRTWKDDLRRSPASPASRKSSTTLSSNNSPISSTVRKSFLNPDATATSMAPSTLTHKGLDA